MNESIGPDFIYVMTQPVQWLAALYGRGPGAPVLGDMYVEQWLTVVPGHSHAFRLHYRTTHFGTDTHASTSESLPAVHVEPRFPRFV